MLVEGTPHVSKNGAQPGTSKTGQQDFASPPSLSLPKGGGAVRGIGEKFAANPVTGTANFTVPIFVSQGRSGFAPKLSLSYDSGSGNSAFGFGWTLALPSITRKTDKGLPQYRDAEEGDIFILSGAEDLVPLLGQAAGRWTREATPARSMYGQRYSIHRYRPRVDGLFAMIERWVNLSDPQDTFWRSISKDNLTTWYGKTAESRIADPSDPSRIFSWLICESYNDKGDIIRYVYKPETSEGVGPSQVNERNRTDNTRSVNRYLKHVFYGNRVPYFPDLTAATEAPLPTDWRFQLVFDYGEHDLLNPVPQETGVPWDCRLDPFSTYRPTFEVRTYRLCRRALMFHHFPAEANVGLNCLIRSTDFQHSAPAPPTDPARPFYSYLLSATQTGYTPNGAGGYLSNSLPPLAFEYVAANVDETVREVDPDSLMNLPYGLDGGHYRWVDLDGEGLSGILTEQAGSWFYKANLSPVNQQTINGTQYTLPRFAQVELVGKKPSTAALNSGRQQLFSLSGDGQLDLVDFEGATPGYFQRTDDADWTTFVPFQSLPVLNWRNPELKFIDVTGDGFPDLLISEGDALWWYKSLSTLGFSSGLRVPQALDEEKGPRAIFSDSTESIFLADLSGDGLSDVVRIRNGEVCYWPNLGYGRFGAKVTMDNAPLFDRVDLYNGRRVHLADIDGSGTVDIIYFSSDSVQLYFNQSGNGWGAARVLSHFPSVESTSSATALDLLGNGTACLVWSSPLAGNATQPMRYIDLMGGQKPHLLVRATNNLGAETALQYAPSTKFYVADKLAGTPWVTRLPFPVHVVERVQTYDYVSRNLFVTRYTYHHGYYDGAEREFRGFGRVDQWDTAEYATLTNSPNFPQPTNVDATRNLPPVCTKTWFHTGAYFGETNVSKYLEHEYYGEGDSSDANAGLTFTQLEAMLLEDTVLPKTILLPDDTRLPYDLSSEELREACRALHGSILRQEIYAVDTTDESDRPYSVSERNYTIEMLQPQGPNKYGVFFVHPRETIDFHYERKLFKVVGNSIADSAALPPNAKTVADPRVTHVVILAVDPFGNTLQSVAVGYGRRYLDPALTPTDQGRQGATLSTYTENTYTNAVLSDDVHRTPLLAQADTFELIRVQPTSTQADVTNLFGIDELQTKLQGLADGLHDIPFENLNPIGLAANQAYRRLIGRTRTYYRPDDMGATAGNPKALLILGKLESLALLGDTYKLTFTPGLLAQAYKRGASPLLPTPATVLASVAADGGGYVDLDGDGNWWIPSGRAYFLPTAPSSPQEKNQALQHFFLPRRFEDPFTNATSVDYDLDDLLITKTTDAVNNVVTATNDYRVLAPALITDPNGNQTAVSFDVLGRVTATAVMGKPGENLGDLLTGFSPDLTQSQINGFYDANDPHILAGTLLGNATTRILYDVHRFNNTRTAAPTDPSKWQPVFSATLARETHVSELAMGQQPKIQITIGYSDGFGREIQKKVQAEPMPAGSLRWVGSGWTIFNNKGTPVRRYEAFFSQLPKGHQFEFGMLVGVSAILCYDAIERIVATIHPNHSYEKVVFDPWHQVSWDGNDTVLQTDPTADPDVGEFFRLLPNSDYSPTWYAPRSMGSLASQEQDAAGKTAAHANTPTVGYFDALGRHFLTVLDNAGGTKFSSRVELDIQDNQRSVRDPIVQASDQQGRIVMRYDYDMLQNRIHQASMEAGERWILHDCTGKMVRSWDSRGHNFRTEFDSLRRPTGVFVLGANASTSDPRTTAAEVLYEKTTYGEGQPAALNLRTRIFQNADAAGIVSNMGHNPVTNRDEAFDFKGNLLRSSRAFYADYKALPNLQALPPTPDVFSSSTQYDALNRIVAATTSDGSVVRRTYNEASLLETVSVNLRAAAAATPFVTNIDYDAKGQRVLVEFGNGAVTTYDYDPLTSRLMKLTTSRSGFSADQRIVQKLSYTYDPVGNITHIQDDADIQNVVFFLNRRVEPSSNYTYDAIYRLVQASGREQLGLSGGTPLPPVATSYNDVPRIFLTPLRGDGAAVGTYNEQYQYDEVGNFLQFIHQGANPANPGWTRSYTYKEPSLLEVGKTSNRLTKTTVSGSQPLDEPYTYDLHGNMLTMPQLAAMQWDFKDQLYVTQRQAVNSADAHGGPHQGERTYYVYDSSGQRVRKATESAGGTKQKERFYLGDFELYREYDATSNVALVRETLHAKDDRNRVALVETKTVDTSVAAGLLPNSAIRYQFGNHLGTACLELDEFTDIISYEEYYPYGSTSYQAGRTLAEVSLKRYRYTGKERDEETGLNYHNARYFASWLGRWTSCDPIQSENLYSYCKCNPIAFIDPAGEEPADPKLPADVGPYRAVEGDHIHQVATRTDRPGAKRSSAASFRGALSKSTTDPSYNDKAGQRSERATNRAAWGKGSNPPKPAARPGPKPPTKATSEGESTVGRSRGATPSQWFEDVKSFHKLRAAGVPAEEAWRIVRASSHQLNAESATPKRVPDAPRDISRTLQQGQRLSPEAEAGRTGAQLPSRSIVRSTVGGLATAGMAGQAITQLHEGHPEEAAKTVGVGFILTKIPAAIPLAIMKSTISHYDETVQEHSFEAGQWVAPNHPIIGAFVASGAATGESLFQATFGDVGRGIGQGAAVVYIRATSDEYTLIPWRSQWWADHF